MKVLVIEDEAPAARRLIRLLEKVDKSIDVTGTVDSVEDACLWFEENQHPDLVFADIQLADGMSFEIFDQIDVKCPIIFTTAFDHYAIKAFKLNSIDYLLKPLDSEELKAALDKFKEHIKAGSEYDQNLKQLLTSLKATKESQYKERFLIKVGEQLKYVHVDQIAYFYFDAGYCSLVNKDGNELVIDYSLDGLAEILNPKDFFRISRKVIVHHSAIKKINSWFSGRLKVELRPDFKGESTVSRDRVQDFKMWLDD